MQKINNKKGEVFAFKTDTVWGFGCHPNDIMAIKKIYEIKKRDVKKPLILMSYDFEPLKKYIKEIPNYAYELIEKHLPGGLTLIFKKTDLVSDEITKTDTIGIRIPNSPDFCELAKQIEGGVLATTSCNITQEPPVETYQEAYEKFSNVATIIQPIEDVKNENIPSTVILCENDEYKILRQGALKLWLKDYLF